jgi:hypothetical protein
MNTNGPLLLLAFWLAGNQSRTLLLTRLSTTSLRRSTTSALRSTFAILRHLPTTRSTRSALFLAFVFADLLVRGRRFEGVGLDEMTLALTFSSQVTIESIPFLITHLYAISSIQANIKKHSRNLHHSRSPSPPSQTPAPAASRWGRKPLFLRRRRRRRTRICCTRLARA